MKEGAHIMKAITTSYSAASRTYSAHDGDGNRIRRKEHVLGGDDVKVEDKHRRCAIEFIKARWKYSDQTLTTHNLIGGWVSAGVYTWCLTEKTYLDTWAETTLALMEEEKDWGPDLWETVSLLARRLKLATHDSKGMFRKVRR